MKKFLHNLNKKHVIFPNNITKFTRKKESSRKILLININAKKIEKCNISKP